MKQGQVVEVGSHSDLIAKPGGTYATLGDRVHLCNASNVQVLL
jgi:ABC-type multidrug transport system fused ATPase/permease subunit